MLQVVPNLRSVVRSVSRRYLPLSATNAAYSSDVHVEQKQKGIRPFKEIPQANGLPTEGFQNTRISELWQIRHAEYGNIYRETIGEVETVYCNSPADTAAIFKSEGRYPNRAELEGLRLLREAMNLPDSIINLRGEDWYKMRRPLNELIMKNRAQVWNTAGVMLEVSVDFMKYIDGKRDENGEIPQFESLMNKWALEMFGTFSFNKRLGLLHDDIPTKITELFTGMSEMMEMIAKRTFSPGYKLNEELENLKIMRKTYAELLDEYTDGSEEFKESLLAKIMERKELTDIDIESLVMDLLFSSFETTARAAELVVYCLTLDQTVQDKLREEVMSLPETLTGKDIDGMKYMNAFIREVNRLYPFSHVFSRTFEHDITLSGFRIPAGTRISNTINVTQNRNPTIFQDPDKFFPERWLDRENKISRFTTSGAFGFGARSCPGRLLAKQEIHILVIALLKQFRVEYHHNPMVSVFKLTGSISEEAKFAFHQL